MRLRGIIARVLVVLASLNLVAGPAFAGAQSINLKAQGNLAEAADKAKIAKDAIAATDTVAQTGKTATQTFNILGNQPWGEAFQTGLFGGTNLTAANVLEGALDGAITSGLSSAVYGTNFADGFKNSLIKNVVALGLADAQIKIGSVFKDEDGNPINGGEGSLGHALLHATAGCAAAELTGARCGAGAAGAIASSLAAGYFARNPVAVDESLSAEAQQARRLQLERQYTTLISGLTGYVFSGGKGENVSAASSIGVSAIINNRQLHIREIELIEQYADDYAEEQCAKGNCISLDEARAILTAETLRGVSDDFKLNDEDTEARAFLNGLQEAGSKLAVTHFSNQAEIL